MTPRTKRTPRRVAAAVALSIAVAACGSSSDDSASDEPAVSEDAQASIDDRVAAGTLSGIVREPAPVVGEHQLPSLTSPGVDVDFAAADGGLQVVYFGYTNCPDLCPTTLFDLTVALRKLDDFTPGSADLIETVMVTVDPDRDLEILPDYLTSFISDGIAVGTPDADDLLAVADPFGVNYEVRTLDDGSIEVDHTPFLYAVNAAGELVLTWQFGASSDDMAADLAILLEQHGATA